LARGATDQRRTGHAADDATVRRNGTHASAPLQIVRHPVDELLFRFGGRFFPGFNRPVS